MRQLILKLKRTTLFIGMLFLVGLISAQTTFYVSNSGSDSNSGTSSDSPWATLTKVNSKTYSPGDEILFNRGDVWRTPSDAAMSANSSGTEDNYITYGAYGSGDKPRILGSNQVTGWENTSGNIWQASLSYNPGVQGYGAELFFELTTDSVAWGVQRSYNASLSDLTQEYDWVWNSNVVYVYATSNPSTRYTSVEAPKTSKLFLYNNYDYIEVDNFEFAYSTNMGLAANYNPGYNPGAIITNNHIHHIGHKNSSQAFGLSVKHSEMYIAYNEINDCGRRNISINLYLDESNPILMENVIIEHNYLHDGWHTTGIDGINSGEHILRNVYIRNNLIEDNKYLQIEDSDRDNHTASNFIYVTADPWATSYSIYIYNNIFKNCKAKQITVDGVDSMYIYNNTFYGMAQNVLVSNSQNIIHCSDGTSGGVGKYWIKNNLFYSDAHSENAKYANCLYIDYDVLDLAQDIDNNLYYSAPSSTGRLVNVYSAGVINEVWKASSLSDWVDFSGFDQNSPESSDPLFVNAPSDLSVESGSPAIGMAEPVSWITTDYYGNPRDPSSPTIGAIEYAVAGTEARITSFSFSEQTSSASINYSTNTVSIEVETGTNLSSLSPSITLSSGATINPGSGVAQNFSSSFTYTVTSLDESVSNEWTVNVSVEAASSETDILSFSIAEQVESAIISAATHTISVKVANGADLSSLTPAITVSDGASINPQSGVSLNFSSSQIMTVTAEDGTTSQQWTVSITEKGQNNSPLIHVQYSSEVYKDFVYELDASGSYDPDNDEISFEWFVPDALVVNSLNESRISIIPDTTLETACVIELIVSDGESVSQEFISLDINNYSPDSEVLQVSSIEASAYHATDYPENILDNNEETRWAAEGEGQWLMFELQEESRLSHFEVCFYNGEERNTYFDVLASNDMENWDLILENGASCGFAEVQAFSPPETKTTLSYKYIKLLGHMNSQNDWNSFSEFKTYGFTGQTSASNLVSMEDEVMVYPNPARDDVYVKCDDNSTIRVLGMTGAVLYEQQSYSDVSKLDYNFENGIYLIQIFDANNNFATKKLVVN